ncbi:hypothetical protein [Streptomyces sp. NPDC058595]|uniref:hypothetical protein n=1 Tax=Streptomyces sp. NPDC058595 TaxID=3346550 RepID=UPI00366845B5
MTRRATCAAAAAALMLGALAACAGENDDGADGGQAIGGTGGSGPESRGRPMGLVQADTTAEVAAIIKKILGPCIQMLPDDNPMPSSKESTTCAYEDGSNGVARLKIHLIDNGERERLHLKADSVGYLLYGKGFMTDFETPRQQQALEAAGLLYLNCDEGFEAYVKANEGVKTIDTVKAATTGCRYTESDLTRFM